jgi:hypothetical protein
MSAQATTAPPGPHETALLRAGPRAAVTVAVTALHLRGAVAAGRPGTLRRTAGGEAPAFRHPLEKAVRTALYRPAGPRELLERAVVRRALARMRADLVAAGLLRPLPPRRTRAARRHLADLRERHPLPEGPGGTAEEDVLYAVALHGEAALTVLLPGFARASRLTGRGALADEGLFPFGAGGGMRGILGGEAFLNGDDDRDGGGDGTDGHHGGHGGHSGHGGHDSGHHGGYGHHDSGGFGCGGGGGGD